MKNFFVLSMFAILLLLSGLNELYAQQRSVSGSVKDESGNPIPGTTVVVKGTSIGVITNTDGKFVINIPDENAILQFSFIGMKYQEVPVNGSKTIDVIMQDDVIGLDEVVTVGYGTAKKSDLTGTVASIRVDEKKDLPNANILQTLQGEIPGVNIGAIDRPGQSPSLSIRGQNSISASNYPLIVLDGIIYNGSLTDININDVAKIDVLKDASASAVYGARSANGVLLITTKKGKIGKPRLSFSMKQGVSTIAKKIQMMDGEQYQQKILDYRSAAGLESDPAKIEQYMDEKEVENMRAGKETDWLDVATRNGYYQEYQLGASGATERTNYYMSGSYLNQKGLALGDQFGRYTLKLNIQNKITNWFTVGVNSSFSTRDYSGFAAEMTHAAYNSPYGRFWKDNIEGGEYDFWPHDDKMARHPLLPLNVDNKSIANNLWFLGSGIIDFPFIKGLKYTFNYGYNYRWNKEYTFYGLNTIEGLNVNGRATRYHGIASSWTMNNILNYYRTFGNNHTVSATLLYSREHRGTEYSSMRGDGFSDKTLGYNNVSLAETQIIGSGAGQDDLVSYMARANYKFKNRYMATFTYRRDGYSGFGTNKKYGDFPSMALAWVVSQENFMSNISWLSYLKIRASYGLNGNQAIGRYATLARIGNIKYLFGDGGNTVFGTYLATMANDDLGWESTAATNIGMDFSILNDRVGGNINYYNSNTYDLILNRSIPQMTGFGSIKTNIGKVHNEGVELALNTIPVKSNAFQWDLGFTFALNRNKIKSLYGLDLDGDGEEDDDLGNRWFIGKSLGAVYDYTTNGIYQLNEDIPFDKYKPGMVRIVDIAGRDDNGNIVMEPDGEITPDDRSIIGYSKPNYRFSIKNNLKFKNLNLYIFLYSIQGGGKNNWYIGNNARMNNPNAWFPNRLNMPVAIDYWTPENPSEKYPIINYRPPRGHGFYEKRSFVRIQDVSLSYSFDHLVNNLGISTLNLYVNVRNLYTFTQWTGFDPEVGSTLGGMPMPRTFMIGLDMTF